MIITIKDWTNGDWVEIWEEEKLVHAGHSVPDSIWLGLLQRAGVTVNEEDVKPDDEEEEC